MTRETVLRSFIVWLGFYYARNLMKISSPGVMRFVPPWSCGTLGKYSACAHAPFAEIHRGFQIRKDLPNRLPNPIRAVPTTAFVYRKE